MRRNFKRVIIALGLVFAFLANSIGPLPAFAQEGFFLPAPGQMVALSPAFSPVVLKGIKLDPKNPFRFHFFVDRGDSNLGQAELKSESSKLIKYFLASLTISEKDLWVNLSPYEKDRIVPQEFGQTEMGRDLLAEDYLLKQITASLIYPESQLGKEFWRKVYAQAQAKYGTTNVPINTFNKVWIVPDKAVVYENGGTVFVLENHLKVMLEQDYLSLAKHEGIQGMVSNVKETNQIGSQIVRELVLPQLEHEVNYGKNFSQLRQVFYSLILATWYKKKIKDSILNKIYSNRNKISGVNVSAEDKDRIYQEYLKAFKKGVFNFIKEEPDPMLNQTMPRKYFSGGLLMRIALTEEGPQHYEQSLVAGLNKAQLTEVIGDASMSSEQDGGISRRSFLKNLSIGLSLVVSKSNAVVVEAGKMIESAAAPLPVNPLSEAAQSLFAIGSHSFVDPFGFEGSMRNVQNYQDSIKDPEAAEIENVESSKYLLAKIVPDLQRSVTQAQMMLDQLQSKGKGKTLSRLRVELKKFGKANEELYQGLGDDPENISHLAAIKELNETTDEQLEGLLLNHIRDVAQNWNNESRTEIRKLTRDIKAAEKFQLKQNQSSSNVEATQNQNQLTVAEPSQQLIAHPNKQIVMSSEAKMPISTVPLEVEHFQKVRAEIEGFLGLPKNRFTVERQRVKHFKTFIQKTTYGKRYRKIGLGDEPAVNMPTIFWVEEESKENYLNSFTFSYLLPAAKGGVINGEVVVSPRTFSSSFTSPRHRGRFIKDEFRLEEGQWPIEKTEVKEGILLFYCHAKLINAPSLKAQIPYLRKYFYIEFLPMQDSHQLSGDKEAVEIPNSIENSKKPDAAMAGVKASLTDGAMKAPQPAEVRFNRDLRINEPSIREGWQKAIAYHLKLSQMAKRLSQLTVKYGMFYRFPPKEFEALRALWSQIDWGKFDQPLTIMQMYNYGFLTLNAKFTDNFVPDSHGWRCPASQFYVTNMIFLMAFIKSGVPLTERTREWLDRYNDDRQIGKIFYQYRKLERFLFYDFNEEQFRDYVIAFNLLRNYLTTERVAYDEVSNIFYRANPIIVLAPEYKGRFDKIFFLNPGKFINQQQDLTEYHQFNQRGLMGSAANLFIPPVLPGEAQGKIRRWKLADGTTIFSKRVDLLRTSFPEEEIVLAKKINKDLQSFDRHLHAQNFVGIVFDNGNFYLLSKGVDIQTEDFVRMPMASYKKLGKVLQKYNVADSEGRLRDKEILPYLINGKQHYAIVDFETMPYRQSVIRNPKRTANRAMNVIEQKKPNSTTGGIDLNPTQMSMQVKKQGEDFKFDFNGTEIDAAQVTGATFTIEQMTPVTDLSLILGLKKQAPQMPISHPI